MTNNKFQIRFLIIIVMILTLSCEENFQIGGSFVNEFNDKPINGLEVGLYQVKDSFPRNSTWDNLELLQTTYTNNNGAFIFNLTDDDIFRCMYLPVPTTDKNSVNSKYVLSERNLDNIDWSKIKKWTLKPSTIAKLTFDKSQITESMKIKYERKVVHWVTNDNNRIFQLYLTSGESHEIGLYTITDEHEILIKNFDVYITPKVNDENRIYWIKQDTIEIKLENK